jgi:hypothetical protein
MLAISVPALGAVAWRESWRLIVKLFSKVLPWSIAGILLAAVFRTPLACLAGFAGFLALLFATLLALVRLTLLTGPLREPHIRASEIAMHVVVVVDGAPIDAPPFRHLDTCLHVCSRRRRPSSMLCRATLLDEAREARNDLRHGALALDRALDLLARGSAVRCGQGEAWKQLRHVAGAAQPVPIVIVIELDDAEGRERLIELAACAQPQAMKRARTQRTTSAILWMSLPWAVQ